jgi:hypothetical protein
MSMLAMLGASISWIWGFSSEDPIKKSRWMGRCELFAMATVLILIFK